MDLASLEQEYMLHVAGASRDPTTLTASLLEPDSKSTTGPAISLWKEADSCAHVDLRGLFDLSDKNWTIPLADELRQYGTHNNIVMQAQNAVGVYDDRAQTGESDACRFKAFGKGQWGSRQGKDATFFIFIAPHFSLVDRVACVA